MTELITDEKTKKILEAIKLKIDTAFNKWETTKNEERKEMITLLTQSLEESRDMADRCLKLATESTDMLGGIIDEIEKAQGEQNK